MTPQALIRMARSVAGQHRAAAMRAAVGRDELIGAAVEGAVALGDAPAALVRCVMQRRMIDAARKVAGRRRTHPTRAAAADQGHALMSEWAQRASCDPADELAAAIDARRALERLSDRERALVAGHDCNGKDLCDLSAQAGVSKSWGTRLRQQALRRLSRWT